MSATPIAIVMPKWGLSMQEGKVNEWLVDIGDRIEVGMPILDVESDKIANSMEAADAGVLRRKLAEPGDVLPVKALLGVLAEPETTDAEIDTFIAGYAIPETSEDGQEDAESAFEEADVDGIRVRFARRGSGPDKVLLLHGFGGDLNNWLFNLDALAASSTVLAIDLPGHGQSDARLPGASLQDLARFVVHFMDAQGISRAHLVGHSMGGAIAAQIALDAPERVSSLSLVSPAGFGDEINEGYTTGFVQATSRRDLKPVVEQLFADPALVTRQMLDDLLRYKRLDGVPEALAGLNATLFPEGRQSARPGYELDATVTPILVMWGGRDRIIPADHARNAPAGSTVRVFDDSGHMSQMEKANEVNTLIKAHVAAAATRGAEAAPVP